MPTSSTTRNLAFYQALQKLPDLAKSILQHDETTDFNGEIIDRFKLNSSQTKALMKLLQLLIMKVLSPKDLIVRVENDLLLPHEQARLVTLEVLGWRALPLEWYLGPVQPVIKNLGGQPEQYLPGLHRIYAEVYSGAPLQLDPKPDEDDPFIEYEKETTAVTSPSHHAEILNHFAEHLGNFAGRAEILLRLTGLGTELEERAKAGTLEKAKAEKMIADLDAMSNAINTRDLNPFEVQALHRRLSRMLGDLE